jgi:hypothetical protein
MNRLNTLVFLYYRLLLVNNLLFSFMIGIVFYLFIAKSYLFLFVLAKLIGFAGATGHYYYMQADSFYYYRNAGISIRRLYAYSLLIDIVIFVLLLSALSLIKICLHLH